MPESFRSQLRRGKEATQATLSRQGGGKFTPVHQFESGTTKYIQFLEPYEDIVEVLMHQFVVVGYRENGDPKYERFISRKDPNLDGMDGYDPLVDRFGLKPSLRNITLGVELEPVTETEGKRKVITGFDVVYRQYEDSEGKTVEVPNVALVIESPYTLFGHLATMDDQCPIEETVLGVNVKGKGKDKQFTIIQTNADALDLTSELEEFFKEFDLDSYVEELASEDRMRELIEPLPDDFPVSKWAKKGKGSSGSSTPQSRRSRRQNEDEGDDGDESNEGEDESPRTRRFADLREKVERTSSSRSRR